MTAASSPLPPFEAKRLLRRLSSLEIGAGHEPLTGCLCFCLRSDVSARAPRPHKDTDGEEHPASEEVSRSRPEHGISGNEGAEVARARDCNCDGDCDRLCCMCLPLPLTEVKWYGFDAEDLWNDPHVDSFPVSMARKLDGAGAPPAGLKPRLVKKSLHISWSRWSSCFEVSKPFVNSMTPKRRSPRTPWTSQPTRSPKDSTCPGSSRAQPFLETRNSIGSVSGLIHLRAEIQRWLRV